MGPGLDVALTVEKGQDVPDPLQFVRHGRLTRHKERAGARCHRRLLRVVPKKILNIGETDAQTPQARDPRQGTDTRRVVAAGPIRPASSPNNTALLVVAQRARRQPEAVHDLGNPDDAKIKGL